MKNLIVIAAVLISGIVTAQTNYEKGMEQAFALWQDNKTDAAKNLFERISSAELDNWLPHYYIAQINSLESWDETDSQILKAKLDKAQEHLDLAMAMSKDNAELLVLQAQVLTNWVAFDGMTYGMKYSGKITELYQKAMALSPNNPRVVLGNAEWNMGSARYFGKDIKPYCKDVEKAIELFANFKPESEFAPNWGKAHAKAVLKSCE
jgi:tetratricopeptide (TPR) repeat protein